MSLHSRVTKRVAPAAWPTVAEVTGAAVAIFTPKATAVVQHPSVPRSCSYRVCMPSASGASGTKAVAVVSISPLKSGSSRRTRKIPPPPCSEFQVQRGKGELVGVTARTLGARAGIPPRRFASSSALPPMPARLTADQWPASSRSWRYKVCVPALSGAPGMKLTSVVSMAPTSMRVVELISELPGAIYRRPLPLRPARLGARGHAESRRRGRQGIDLHRRSGHFTDIAGGIAQQEIERFDAFTRRNTVGQREPELRRGGSVDVLIKGSRGGVFRNGVTRHAEVVITREKQLYIVAQRETAAAVDHQVGPAGRHRVHRHILIAHERERLRTLHLRTAHLDLPVARHGGGHQHLLDVIDRVGPGDGGARPRIS